MYKTKLIQYLKTFTKSEITQFGKFLQSPYFNNSKLLIQLFQILKRHHPDFESKMLDRKKVFRKLFPNQKFHEKKLGNLCSDMDKLIEKFWIVEQIDTKPKFLKKEKIKVFRERNMSVYFKREILKFLEELEAIKSKSLYDFQELLELHHLNYFHPATKKSSKEHESIEELNLYTDYFYAFAKLLYGSELLSRNNFLQHSQEPLLIKEVKEKLIPKLPTNNESITLLNKVSTLITAPPSIEVFEDVHNYFEQKFSYFTKELQSIGFFYLINYISRHQANGAAIFREKIAELYWFGYRQQLIIVDGKMSSATFLNFINVATPFSVESDILNFIKNAASLLKKDNKNFTLTFGKATFYYLIKNFEKSSNYLNQISEIPPLSRLTVWTVKLRNSLELSIKDKTHFSVFFSNCTNFSQFLKRDRILSDERKESCYNFQYSIRKFGKLISENKFTKIAKENLLAEINATEKIYLKFWLVKRIEESN